MNRAELISRVALNTGLTKKEAERVLVATSNAIAEALEDGEDVSIFGFGSFVIKERPARVGHNPQTGKSIDLPAVRFPMFKSGKMLKDAVTRGSQRDSEE